MILWNGYGDFTIRKTCEIAGSRKAGFGLSGARNAGLFWLIPSPHRQRYGTGTNDFRDNSGSNRNNGAKQNGPAAIVEITELIVKGGKKRSGCVKRENQR